MKANELRIGNYVQNIHDPGFILYTEVDGYLLTELVDELEPINISEEWLIKLGFEETDDLLTDKHQFTDYIKNGVRIEKPYFDFKFEEGEKSIDIKYVHQLQNLYYVLIGEELTITQ